MEAGNVSQDPSSTQPAAKKRVPIFIPSHEEVLRQSRPQAPPSLFRPSSSSASSLASFSATAPPLSSHPAETFTEAFSFVKKTEFYSPPPVPPDPSPSTSTAPLAPANEASTGHGPGPKLDAPCGGHARNAILVSRKQQGNPVLKHIKNVRWIYADIVPDYLLGQSSCALYLSLRYHLLHPDYLYFRIRELLKSFRLRIVFCFVDVSSRFKRTTFLSSVQALIWVIAK
ncbi:hypothetical protein L7F22_031248 [Adiantum nelumboides]|nr:hypothetical protein [Adiantum nelumboides]